MGLRLTTCVSAADCRGTRLPGVQRIGTGVERQLHLLTIGSGARLLLRQDDIRDADANRRRAR